MYLEEEKSCSKICRPGYFKKGLNCLKCTGNCLECIWDNSQSCLSCKEGFYLNELDKITKSGKCEKFKCNNLAYECDSNKIISCFLGYYLKNGTCVDKCDGNWIVDSKNRKCVEKCPEK